MLSKILTLRQLVKKSIQSILRLVNCFGLIPVVKLFLFKICQEVFVGEGFPSILILTVVTAILERNSIAVNLISKVTTYLKLYLQLKVDLI